MTRLGALIVLSVAVPISGLAGNGVLEINQVCATQTGCLSGDAPGFPVSITSPGSYRLTSSLAVTDPDLDAIDASAAGLVGVTIDLNGFEIAGPVTCTGFGSAVSCTPVSFGRGIDALSASGVTVRDGRVRGFGSTGVSTGGRSQIRNVVAESNRGNGIFVEIASVIGQSTAYQNEADGISAGAGSVVEHRVAHSNGENGIQASVGATVLGSAARDNGFDGISATGTGCVVRDSSAHQNEDDGIEVGSASHVSDNAAFNNGNDGIFANFGSSVQRNTAGSNGGFGLNLADEATYLENSITNNTGGTVNGGQARGGNFCDGAAVPNCP